VGSTVKLTSPSIQPKDPSNKSGYLANTSAGVRPLGGVVSCAAQMFSSIIGLRSKSSRQHASMPKIGFSIPLCYVEIDLHQLLSIVRGCLSVAVTIPMVANSVASNIRNVDLGGRMF